MKAVMMTQIFHINDGQLLSALQ